MKAQAKRFTAIVTLISKHYDRRARTWRLDLSINSSSGLPYGVKSLHIDRKNARHIKNDVLYKARGLYWPTGDCMVEWLDDLANLLAIKKYCLREKHLTED